MELAKRIYRMNPEQSEEFQSIIINNQTDDMRLVAEEGKQPHYYNSSCILTFYKMEELE
jgi:hypothetical protein